MLLLFVLWDIYAATHTHNYMNLLVRFFFFSFDMMADSKLWPNALAVNKVARMFIFYRRIWRCRSPYFFLLFFRYSINLLLCPDFCELFFFLFLSFFRSMLVVSFLYQPICDMLTGQSGIQTKGAFCVKSNKNQTRYILDYNGINVANGAKGLKKKTYTKTEEEVKSMHSRPWKEKN